MKSLRDAQSAAKNLGHAIGHPAQQQADIIADAFASLEDRLSAAEDILRALAHRAALSADDILQATPPPQAGRAPTRREAEIRRILG